MDNRGFELWKVEDMRVLSEGPEVVDGRDIGSDIHGRCSRNRFENDGELRRI